MKCIQNPIRLSHSAVAVIHMFHKEHNLDTLFISDDDQYNEDNYNNYEDSANEFINQLEDQYCIAFLQALKIRVDKELEEWEEELNES